MEKKWLQPALLVLPMLMLTACAPRQLAVMPSTPPAPPRLAIPEFAKACPTVPSWYPPGTCKPAPTARPTP